MTLVRRYSPGKGKEGKEEKEGKEGNQRSKELEGGKQRKGRRERN